MAPGVGDRSKIVVGGHLVDLHLSSLHLVDGLLDIHIGVGVDPHDAESAAVLGRRAFYDIGAGDFVGLEGEKVPA